MSDRIPRLEMADMRADLADYLTPRVERLRYLGELFKCAGHAPDVLLQFMHFTDALKQALPDRLTELGALTVASYMENRYERHQHERLSVKLGFPRLDRAGQPARSCCRDGLERRRESSASLCAEGIAYARPRSAGRVRRVCEPRDAR